MSSRMPPLGHVHCRLHATGASLARRAAVGLVLLLAAACAENGGLPTGPAPTEGTLSGASASGVTYYVSPTGNNNNAGTSPAKAWKTIAKVNGKAFNAGDRILFKGGAVFNGNLAFNALDKGSPSAPIVVGSYGTGRATISAGAGTAISLYNTAGFEIRSLHVVGSGRTLNTGSGVSVYADLAGGVKLPYIRVDSVEANGFGQYGIVMGSWNGTTGYTDVRVTNASSHDNALAGVATYAQLPYAHQNVYFGHLLAYNNSGVATLTTNSGSGILMGGVLGGTIERSVAHGNGWLCTAAGGPVGIWTYDSDGIVIQYNESYDNRTGGPADGGGFDLDQNVRRSTVQYNYSHGNDGPGFLLAHAPNNTSHADNTVRYNVSENDGRKNSAAAIVIYGRTIRAELYNNTVYVAPSASGTPSAVAVHNVTIVNQDVQQVHFRNNVFYVAGGLRLLWVSTDQLNGAVDLRFEGNDYYAGGAAPNLLWGSTTYAGLTGWRSATGQELLGGVGVGSQLDPALLSPGAGGTIGNADLLANLTAYRLQAGSPVINRALDLPALFGISVGASDFYGDALPSGTGYDVGSYEWH